MPKNVNRVGTGEVVLVYGIHMSKASSRLARDAVTDQASETYISTGKTDAVQPNLCLDLDNYVTSIYASPAVLYNS